MKKFLFLLVAGMMTVATYAQPGTGVPLSTDQHDTTVVAEAVVDPMTGGTIEPVVEIATATQEEATGFSGAYRLDFFMWCLAFGLLGIFISVNISANHRDVASERTPEKFSYLQMLRDNWKRGLLTFAILYAALRFMPDLMNLELSQGRALAAGLGFDRLLLLFKNKKGEQ